MGGSGSPSSASTGTGGPSTWILQPLGLWGEWQLSICVYLLFLNLPQSIKPAFMPQIFETIKYYYFVGILMTSIFFCFFFFFFLIHFSLVYYCFVLLENSNIFSLRDFAILLTSYFKRIRLFSTLRKMLAKLTSGRGSV